MHSKLTEPPPRLPNHQRWLARHLALGSECQDKTGTVFGALQYQTGLKVNVASLLHVASLGRPPISIRISKWEKIRGKESSHHPTVTIIDAVPKLQLLQLSSITSILLQIKMSHFHLRQRGAVPKQTSPGKRARVHIRQTDLRLRTIHSGMPGLWGV